MLIVDASVLVPALVDDTSVGDRARARLHGEQIRAPALIDIEVVSAVRRLVARGQLDARRAALAVDDLAELSFERAPHLPLLPRVWVLRDNLTAYDAAYIALAEALDVELLTADARLARAPGIRCTVSVVS